MNKLTKYDVVDILLVCLCVSYVPLILIMFFFQVTTLIQEMGDRGLDDGVFLSMLFFQFCYCFIVCVFMYFLILKRTPIIRWLFPESATKEIAIPDGLVILTQYSFWIRLAGIMIILREVKSLIQWITAEFVMSRLEGRIHNLFAPSFQALAGVSLAALIIWKADWISEKVNRIANYQSHREMVEYEDLADTNESNTSPDADIEE